ncbi:MAG: hypothetical protein ACRCS4_00690 [Flavobacterium sp.]
MDELSALYPSDFTKKEAKKTGKELVERVLEYGEVDKMQFGANLARLNEVISSAMDEFRETLWGINKQTVMGVEFNPVMGGDTLNYCDDPVWMTLKAELHARTELLKLAQKQDMFDAYGNEVPKVSTTPRKSSVTIKF